MEEKTLVLVKPEGVQGQGLPETTSRLVTQSGLKLVAVKTVLDIDGVQQKLGLTATTASPMAGYGRGHSFFLKMAMGAEF